MQTMAKNVYLILANGKVFAGKSFGACAEVVGELVFSTSMTGYVEALTDPSYFGQILVQTFPCGGNYGFMSADCESECSHLRAYVVREWCQDPSNFRCEGDLDTFLQSKNIVGLYGIDTRALTKIIRDEGVMNAKIAFSDDACDKVLKEIADFSITDAVATVSPKTTTQYKSENARKNVALLDLGTCSSTINALTSRGCNVTVYPHSTSPADILASNPDGILISEGPGNPYENKALIETVKALCDSGTPILGIGLGHELIAISAGGKCEKLHYGHRGSNQPVSYLSENRVIVTAQNHNYAVCTDSLPENVSVTFKNVNDNSCEGIKFTDKPIVGVSFRPSTVTAPLSTGFVFDSFVVTMTK